MQDEPDMFRNAGDVATQVVDRWRWWHEALRKRPEDLVATLQPEQGYYRVRYKSKRTGQYGQWQPVAIWYDDELDQWLATRDGNEVHADDIWTHCCSNPITIEAYDKAMAGGGFDDEPPRARGIGDNSADVDPLVALRLEFLGEKEMALEFLSRPVCDKNDADRAAIWSKRCFDISKQVDELHRIAKRPVIEEGRRIDNHYREMREEPRDLGTRLKRHCDEYFREEERRERERQRVAREEAERLRREAEAAELAARHADVIEDEAILAARQEEIDRLKQEAALAEKEAQERRIQAGRTGAKVSLRTFYSAEITDFDQLLQALKDRPEIRELVQSLANRAAKSKIELPGMKIIEERRAV